MATNKASVETDHTDIVHDAQLDYYGKQLATCSSDHTVKVYSVVGDVQTKIATLHGHEGPVWQVSWAHPKFGNVLASCGYDHRVIVWRGPEFQPVYTYADHKMSVNSVAWAPFEYGRLLACASADGSFSVLTWKGMVPCDVQYDDVDDGSWDAVKIFAHQLGINAISWAPPSASSYTMTGTTAVNVCRLVTGGCDGFIRIWKCTNGKWEEEKTLQGHTNWVRDVAWCPNDGMPGHLIASGSQDQTVVIWKADDASGTWVPTTLNKFKDTVWRVSWSVAGNILAVSSGDMQVSLWKEGVDGRWECISTMDESSMQ